MATPAISPSAIRSGPGIIYYKYGLTTMPTVTAAASKVVVPWVTDTWTQVGATEDGLRYSESVDTEELRVAESQYPVRVVETGKSGTIEFSLSHIHDLNWKLANNGGTITVTGTGATKLSAYVPPLVGQSVRVALGFQSLDDDEVIIWPQVFNSGGFETARAGLETLSVLPVSFSVELPDTSVLATPYKRWTSGGLALGT